MDHRAKVLTVSTSAYRGTRRDESGASVSACLLEARFSVVARALVPDGLDAVAGALSTMSRDFCGLVVTTGGTGFAPSDVTPEATLSVIDREAPGLAELSRSASSLGGLSRGRAGTLGGCLILNLPGSPKGAMESLESVLPILPHALDLLSEKGAH